MKRLDQIDPMLPGRRILSAEERALEYKRQQEEEKIQGYQTLEQLCQISEVAAAQRLAQAHPHWGYEILEGSVHTKEEENQSLSA